jgi:hypothetical protein
MNASGGIESVRDTTTIKQTPSCAVAYTPGAHCLYLAPPSATVRVDHVRCTRLHRLSLMGDRRFLSHLSLELPGLQRRWRRRLARHPVPAKLSAGWHDGLAGVECDLALADLSLTYVGFRLRHCRLLRSGPAVQHAGPLRRARA